MNIELRTEQRKISDKNPALEPWNPGAMETLWARWSGQDLPMMRALLSPRCELSAMNQALLSILKYHTEETVALTGLPLQRFLPDWLFLTSAKLWTSGFLYDTLRWRNAHGAIIGIRMLLVQASDPSSGVFAIIGVGAPDSKRTLPKALSDTTTH